MNALELRAAEQGVAPEPYMPIWFASLCTSNHGTGELERSADWPTVGLLGFAFNVHSRCCIRSNGTSWLPDSPPPTLPCLPTTLKQLDRKLVRSSHRRLQGYGPPSCSAALSIMASIQSHFLERLEWVDGILLIRPSLEAKPNLLESATFSTNDA